VNGPASGPAAAVPAGPAAARAANSGSAYFNPDDRKLRVTLATRCLFNRTSCLRKAAPVGLVPRALGRHALHSCYLACIYSLYVNAQARRDTTSSCPGNGEFSRTAAVISRVPALQPNGMRVLSAGAAKRVSQTKAATIPSVVMRPLQACAAVQHALTNVYMRPFRRICARIDKLDRDMTGSAAAIRGDVRADVRWKTL
jgi:hypothetical protein